MYCQLEWGVDVSSVFGVMVFHRDIVNWSGGGHVSSVYVHSAICDTYLV